MPHGNSPPSKKEEYPKGEVVGIKKYLIYARSCVCVRKGVNL